MKYLALLIFLLSKPGYAQSSVIGLGQFIIGITTPDSLNSRDFKEQEQAYIKGTLTLPCTHIRSSTATTLRVSGVLIANLTLFFYDNRLFKLTCTYSSELAKAFRSKHGDGRSKPVRYVQFCAQKKEAAMALRNEIWQNADVLALVVHSKGYNSNCREEETSRLIIVDQRILSLTSDCDLQSVDPSIEEFDATINNHQEQHQKKGRVKD